MRDDSEPTQVVAYTAEDTVVLIEISPVAGFVPAASHEKVIGRIKDALGPAVAVARTVLDELRDAAPDQVEVTFGVKATGTMNWLVAKAASEGNFEVKLSWDRRSARRVVGDDDAG